ncbi:hypothetical protein SLA2020_433060 [Shorea laevis]
MEKCSNLAYDFRRSLLQCLSKRDELRAVFLPGSEVPNWFSHQGIGSSISFDVPPLSEGEIQGLLVCAVYAAKEESNVITGCSFHENHHIPLKRYQFEMESGEEVEVSIMAGDDFEVKKCGIHLLFGYGNVDMESAKRGRDDDEAGPSNQEKCPKRSRMESI